MKLWTGRFKKDTDPRVNAFQSSIGFDCRMYREDIAGSLAHSQMLAKQGIISQEDCKSIHQGLGVILTRLEEGSLAFDPQAEDIHSFIEAELTALVGQAGKKLHTARSRNDQVALDIRLYLKNRTQGVLAQLARLVKALRDLGGEHIETVMPGYTHLQRAQPITLGLHLAAYAYMFLRDMGRLTDAAARMDLCPLGCGALAGTTYPIDRSMTAAALGFRGPVPNSLDGVSDRDFCVELTSALALTMVHMSRLCEEVILWCGSEFGFVELDEGFATGSSIMPQKKNPDVAELIRGKTGRVIGALTGLLTMLKGLPLAYNKDMQEDKEGVFDAFDTVQMCLESFVPMLATMEVNKTRLRAAAARGFINATDCADYLTKKGAPFRDAYKLTGELVALCIEKGLTLETLPLESYREYSPLFEGDIYETISIERCAFSRASLGGPAPISVAAQLEEIGAMLEVYGYEG